jgi:alkylation response protein AidB-like acyl-CoA dehydrogenase
MGRLELFRTQTARWFAENTPRDWQLRTNAMTAAEWLEFQRSWLTTLNTVGFGAPQVPREWGGGGYSVAEQAVIYETGCQFDAPQLRAYTISLQHVPATLLRAGTRQQQERFVRDAIAGTVWCQGFSEPEAGSDLAALRTRAVKVPGGYRVSGHKIWSSNAHLARWCLLLARTDPAAPRRQGISYLILDMEADGVEVRPIRTATGHSEFCEIFLEDVWLPDDCLIGGEGAGWEVAQRTLAAERGPIAIETNERIAAGISDLGRRVLSSGWSAADRLSYQAMELAELIAQSRAVRSLAQDAVDAIERGGNGAALSSLIKVSSSDLLRRSTSSGTVFSGAESLVDPETSYPRGWYTGHSMSDFVNSWAWSIAGGTNEIQQSIIAERILGLPREPKPA